MPYSVDSDENKLNPSTPSEVSLTEQLLYKLASLDAAVTQGFRRLDEKMDRFQSDLHESQLATNDRINQLDKEVAEQFAFKRRRIDNLEALWNSSRESLATQVREDKSVLEKRLIDLETWQKVIMARIGIATVAVLIFWTLFGPAVRAMLGVSNG